ncbi:hypothetical protein WA171_004156, partial [Blastocystis sp. BT1]
MWKYHQVRSSFLYDYSTVSAFLYYFVVIFVSVGMVLVLSSVQDWKKMAFHALLLCLRIMANCFGYINVLKLFTGRPRPCFFDMCGYPKSSKIPFLYGTPGMQGDITKCTANVYAIHDAMRSFPSGHASISGSAFMIFLIFSKVIQRHYLKQSRRFSSVIKIVQLVLSISSIAISATRIFDYRHFASDTVAGYLLGLYITLATNNQVQLSYLLSLKRPSNVSSTSYDEMIEDEVRNSGVIRLHMFQPKRFDLTQSNQNDMKVI